MGSRGLASVMAVSGRTDPTVVTTSHTGVDLDTVALGDDDDEDDDAHCSHDW